MSVDYKKQEQIVRAMNLLREQMEEVEKRIESLPSPLFTRHDKQFQEVTSKALESLYQEKRQLFETYQRNLKELEKLYRKEATVEVRFSKKRRHVFQEYDIKLGKTYHATEAIISNSCTDVMIEELGYFVNSCALSDAFMEKLEKAIRWFDRHEGEMEHGIFVRDYY